MLEQQQLSLTFVQALQMVALVPCLIVVFYLIFTAKKKSLAVIPIMYFISLSAGLLNLLLPAFIDFNEAPHLEEILLIGEFFIPSLSFLLIFQFILNRIPPLLYWSVLAIPAIATWPFIFGTVHNDLLCTTIDVCLQSDYVLQLNNVIISSFIFFLLILVVSRRSSEIVGNQELKKHKYWLVLSLIVYNVGLLLLDLGLVSGNVIFTKYILAKTIFKIAFIYMVMTSIFRVFTDLFDVKHLNMYMKKNNLTKYELSLGDKILKLLEEKKVYQETGFNRAKLSEILGVSEHMLSKIINLQFKKSISDVANDYRVKEAKELLASSETPITNISFDVGFNSIASFNRVFKNLTGKSPTQYRDDMKKEII